MAKKFWLFKTEPDVFGLSHLKRCRNRTTLWDGVRNYQARNLLRDEIGLGDAGLLYHSRISPPEIVATLKVVRAGYPDPTQFDPKEKYYDPKSSLENPRWYCVDVQLDEVLPHAVTLPQIKENPDLDEMVLVRRSRLSVQPVTPREWRTVLKMSR